MDIKINGEKVEVSDKPKQVFLYYRESAVQSMIADLTLFGVLFVGLFMNHLYLDSRWYIDIFFLLLMVMWGSRNSKERWNEFTKLSELKKFVAGIKE